jgi:hypothetical protein
MYPAQALTQLAVRKGVLQRRITRCRTRCADAAVQVARPLVWLDQMLAYWRKLPPLVRLAVVPAGLFAQRTFFKRGKLLGSLFRRAPLAFAALRGVIQPRRAGQ